MAFDSIRRVPVIETRPEHLHRVLREGRVSTNVFLRRIHNFALDMTWLPWPVIVKVKWPNIVFGEKHAITLAEHQRIVALETNPERRAFYQLAWHLGGVPVGCRVPRGDEHPVGKLRAHVPASEEQGDGAAQVLGGLRRGAALPSLRGAALSLPAHPR